MVFYFLCDLQRHCAEEKYRTTSQHKPGAPLPAHVEQDPPYILRSLSTCILICLGHVRDFVGKRFKPVSYQHLMPKNVRLQSFSSHLSPARLRVGTSLLFQSTLHFLSDAVLTIYPGLCTTELRFRFLRYSKVENKHEGMLITAFWIVFYNHTQRFTGTCTRALRIISHRTTTLASHKRAVRVQMLSKNLSEVLSLHISRVVSMTCRPLARLSCGQVRRDGGRNNLFHGVRN